MGPVLIYLQVKIIYLWNIKAVQGKETLHPLKHGLIGNKGPIKIPVEVCFIKEK